MERDTLVLFSGGLDSTVALLDSIENHLTVRAITFDYGQKSRKELVSAKKICELLHVVHDIVQIPLGQIMHTPSLLNDEVDHKDTDGKGKPAFYVPNRNQIFITLAHAYAQEICVSSVTVGFNFDRAYMLPDATPEFLKFIEVTSNIGSGRNIKIKAPLLKLSKEEVYKKAHDLDRLDFVNTYAYTCYNNGDKGFSWGEGCGECPACLSRREAYASFYNKLVKA